LLRLDPASNESFDPWPDIGRIDCPIFVIRGGRSSVVPDETIHAMRAANARLECIDIPDAGHNVHLDNAAAFNRELVAFLNRS
jgi:pimeloyl-ACP methyl ester carboxylesterase